MSSTMEADSHYLHLRQLNESLRDAQINPSIVIIIIILTIIFFLSGCLHLLIRCLVMRSPRRDPNSIVALTALQGQLQQLFHLHDAGVEQAFIDTLPVFFYKSVTGLKEGTGADCAVCLCEFEADDRLRLLPKCSHAFHMDCIDTWLLSHSTCPLCRRSLLPDDFAAAAAGHSQHIFGMNHNILINSINTNATNSNRSSVDLHQEAPVPDSTEEQGAEDINRRQSSVAASQNLYAGKVLSVQLGRLRAVESSTPIDTGFSSSIMNGSEQRSYSVGSYEYVLNPYSLEVVIAPTPLYSAKRTPRRPNPNIPGHRTTLSECDPADQDLLQDPSVTPFAITGYTYRSADFHQGNVGSLPDNVSFGSVGSSTRSLQHNAGLPSSNRDNGSATNLPSTQAAGALHNLTCSSCTCSAVGDVLASATTTSIQPSIENYQRLRPELDRHDKDGGNALKNNNSVTYLKGSYTDPQKNKHGENNRSINNDKLRVTLARNSPKVSSEIAIEMPSDLSSQNTLHHHHQQQQQHQHLEWEHDSAAVVRQAQSFRQPINPDIAKLRVSASRRSLSDTDTSFGRGSVTWEDDQERSFQVYSL